MKKTPKKHALSKAAIPFVALFGGNGFASSRNPLSLQSSAKKSSKSVVYLQNIERPEVPDLTPSGQIPSPKTPFAAFTRKSTQQLHQGIDRQNNLALKVLEKNNLLSSKGAVRSDVSGNTMGRKNFSDDWIASTRLPNVSMGTNSACLGSPTYGGQSLTFFFAFRLGATNITCSLRGDANTTLTIASVTMTSTNQGGRCRDFHMACDGQPLPVELMEFEVE